MYNWDYERPWGRGRKKPGTELGKLQKRRPQERKILGLSEPGYKADISEAQGGLGAKANMAWEQEEHLGLYSNYNKNS